MRAVAATPAQTTLYQDEAIAGISGLDYAAVSKAPDVKVKLPAGGWGQPVLTLYRKEAPLWEGMVLDTGFSTIVIISTLEGYAGTSGGGIRGGQRVAQLVESYGPASRTVAGRQGTYHVYEEGRIIFRTDAENLVRGWMVYGIN